jgi:hypothetical protein
VIRDTSVKPSYVGTRCLTAYADTQLLACASHTAHMTSRSQRRDIILRPHVFGRLETLPGPQRHGTLLVSLETLPGPQRRGTLLILYALFKNLCPLLL